MGEREEMSVVRYAAATANLGLNCDHPNKRSSAALSYLETNLTKGAHGYRCSL